MRTYIKQRFPFTCYFLFILSMNFTFQKYYAAQTLCSHSIIKNSSHFLSFNNLQINVIVCFIWKFDAFSLGNLAHRNSYSYLHRSSSTPANISISRLEIPNRTASSRHPFTASITSEIIFSAVLRFSM